MIHPGPAPKQEQSCTESWSGTGFLLRLIRVASNLHTEWNHYVYVISPVFKDTLKDKHLSRILGWGPGSGRARQPPQAARAKSSRTPMWWMTNGVYFPVTQHFVTGLHCHFRLPAS